MRKSMHVMVNLEPPIYVALEQLVLQEAASSEGNIRGALAAKCRKLIIDELIERGVMTQDALIEACL